MAQQPLRKVNENKFKEVKEFLDEVGFEIRPKGDAEQILERLGFIRDCYIGGFQRIRQDDILTALNQSIKLLEGKNG